MSNENYIQETNMQNRMEEEKKKKTTGKKRGRPKKTEWEKLVDSMPFIHKPSRDINTGEIDLTTIELKEGSIVINKKDQQKQQEKKHAQELFQRKLEAGHFIQTSGDFMNLFGELTQAQWHSLMLLIPYVQFYGKPLKKDGKLLTIGDIYNIWGVSRSVGTTYVDKFVEVGIAETENSKTSIREKYFILKTNFLFKGNKEFDEFNTKIVQKKMEEVITIVTEKVHSINTDKRRKKKLELYPLSLLAVLIAHVHYQTFYLVSNPNEPVVLEGETVQEVLKSSHKRRRLKHLKKAEIWNKFTGQNRKSLDKERSERLQLYFDMLHDAGALMEVKVYSKRLLVNPDLMYVTPNAKNSAWHEHILSMIDGTIPTEDEINEKTKK
ncbi:TPA: hypothetical protein QCU60_004327 [Bacillus cereus]|nr:hypothetical protein [Bacillus cereus]HDR6312341.1 hypothetical protein [Bacillus cereus]